MDAAPGLEGAEAVLAASTARSATSSLGHSLIYFLRSIKYFWLFSFLMVESSVTYVLKRFRASASSEIEISVVLSLHYQIALLYDVNRLLSNIRTHINLSLTHFVCALNISWSAWREHDLSPCRRFAAYNFVYPQSIIGLLYRLHSSLTQLTTYCTPIIGQKNKIIRTKTKQTHKYQGCTLTDASWLSQTAYQPCCFAEKSWLLWIKQFQWELKLINFKRRNKYRYGKIYKGGIWFHERTIYLYIFN